MKQAFGIFLAILIMPTFQVQAWIGGPFSGNSYHDNGDDGVYEAIGSMTDGTAMYRWAVNNENAGGVPMTGADAGGSLTSNVQFGGLVGASSPHVIWYRGVVYYGRCFGLVNSNMGRVSVTGSATIDGLSGSGNPNNGVTLNGAGNQSTPAIGNTVVIPDTKSVANSTWKGKITSKYPMKSFHGYGTVSFLGSPSLDLLTVTVANITVTGGGNVFVPNVINVETNKYTSTSAGSSFLQAGHRVGMKVFGTQVSFSVNG
ncbi:MAG: hypothetical protein KDN20_17715 [Verrucomicrobiae bacterium]|nr:hypothetical protein [Verrucomicrobiae bacterium]